MKRRINLHSNTIALTENQRVKALSWRTEDGKSRKIAIRTRTNSFCFQNMWRLCGFGIRSNLDNEKQSASGLLYFNKRFLLDRFFQIFISLLNRKCAFIKVHDDVHHGCYLFRSRPVFDDIAFDIRYFRVSSTNLPSVLQKFEEYESKYGLGINSRRLRRRVVVVFVFLFMCSLTTSFAMVFAVQADLVAHDSVIVNSWTPFQYFPDDILIPLAILIQIRVIIVSLFINCSIGVYAVIISFLKSEYKSVESMLWTLYMEKEEFVVKGHISNIKQ